MIGSLTEVLTRLTALSQELAGAFRPTTIVEIVARVLTEQLAPGRLSVMLLDIDKNQLAVTYHNGPRPASTDEPLLQLALRRGPLVFPDNVAARVAELGVTLDGGGPTPPSWRPRKRPRPTRTAARSRMRTRWSCSSPAQAVSPS